MSHSPQKYSHSLWQLPFFVGLGLAPVACSVGPEHSIPEVTGTDTPGWSTPLGDTNADASHNINLHWWLQFNDPLLTSYIERAVADNPSIEAARARVEAARAARGESRASGLPSLDAEGHRDRTRSSGAINNQTNSGSLRTSYSGILSASWEIDFFGRTRRAVEAADAQIENTEEARRALLLATIAEVARAYHSIRGIQRQIASTEKNVDLQAHTVGLVENLFGSGEASEFDLSRARGQLQLTRSRLPDLDAELHANIHRLGSLIGQPPGALKAELLVVRPLPPLPEIVPVGARSEILRRRPDIRQAEREIAQAIAEIGVATADFFPRFTLLGNFGRVATSSRDLDLSNANAYGVTQLIEWPIFQGGALRARLDFSKANTREAAANYEATVLNALADAETALIRYLRKLENRAALSDAVQSRQRSVELARALFNAGEEDFLPVLDAERELLAAEDELVLGETDSVLNLITLYAALGGGWEAFE